ALGPVFGAAGEAFVIDDDEALRGFEQEVDAAGDAAGAAGGGDAGGEGDFAAPDGAGPAGVDEAAQGVAGADEVLGLEGLLQGCRGEQAGGDREAIGGVEVRVVGGQEGVQEVADVVPALACHAGEGQAAGEALDGQDAGARQLDLRAGGGRG